MTSAIVATARAVVPARTALITDASTKIGYALAHVLTERNDVKTHLMLPDVQQLFQVTLHPRVGRWENLVYDHQSPTHTRTYALENFFSKISRPDIVFHTANPFTAEETTQALARPRLFKRERRRTSMLNSKLLDLSTKGCEFPIGNLSVSRHFFIDPHLGYTVSWARLHSNSLRDLNGRVNSCGEEDVSSTLVGLNFMPHQNPLEGSSIFKVDEVASRLIEMAFADKNPPAELTWQVSCGL